MRHAREHKLQRFRVHKWPFSISSNSIKVSGNAKDFGEAFQKKTAEIIQGLDACTNVQDDIIHAWGRRETEGSYGRNTESRTKTK